MNKKALLWFTSLVILASIFILSKTDQPHLTILGPVSMADGLGRQSVELIDALKDHVDISFRSTGTFILDGIPPKIQKILKKKAPLGKVIIYEDFLVVNGKPLNNNITSLRDDSSIRIAYSMFEASLIPSEWAHVLNHYFDAVLVPDQFLIEVYKNSGVTIPIFELPLGLNLDKFYQAPLKTKKNHPMVFANLSAAFPRKNQLKLLKAFHQVFGNSPDVRLKLNSRNSDPTYSKAIKDELRLIGATNIDFTEMVLEEDLYFKIFQEIDCYVSLSLGEGFSIQPREAMALGIPIIITDNTGQSTICASGLGKIVPSLNQVPAFYPASKDYYGISYDCNIEDVVIALRDMYENYNHYLQKGNSARKWAKQYSYDQLKPLYLTLVKPKKIVLGNINKLTSDCLFTDSVELCEKLNRLHF